MKMKYPKRGPIRYGEDRRIHDAERKTLWRKNNPLKIHARNRTAKSRYQGASLRARKTGREFTISLEKFSELILLPCSYCGYPLDETGSGLDRMDNSKGYTLENSTPCCGACNAAKSHRWTFLEMRDIIGPAIKRVKDLRLSDCH